ncbi:MAG: DnaB-like helicase N-terminal domain-containing protein, partial [Clostridia bacterium]|nr:DnaB-like helicase N-terminal domain-containing protein [Clostridia bacterium]
MSENVNDIAQSENLNNMQQELNRTVPFSNEAEQSVLGSMFLDRTCIPEVINRVKADDFYIERHRMLYNSLVELYSLGKPIDLITIEEKLRLNGDLDKIGGIRFVVDVANAVPSTESVIYYADIVKDKAVLRKLIKLAVGIENMCYRGDEETDDILANAQQGIIDISQNRSTTGLVNFGIYINDSIEQLSALAEKNDAVTGIPTGFIDVDRKTSGLHPAELVLIAGRP